jgi:hypothetical protein
MTEVLFSFSSLAMKKIDKKSMFEQHDNAHNTSKDYNDSKLKSKKIIEDIYRNYFLHQKEREKVILDILRFIKVYITKLKLK